MPPKSNKLAGRKKVDVVLPPLSADRFYAGIKKKPGPKRRAIIEVSRVAPKPVGSRHCSYSVSYKLRVLSYWNSSSIPIGPSRKRQPTRKEVADRFKIPCSNLTRWQREEKAGKFLLQGSLQKRGFGGGRTRKWIAMERILYQQFLERRGKGQVVRRSWFRRTSRQLFEQVYSFPEKKRFAFSNGWFCGFLSWHQISLRFVKANKASQLPSDFTESILSWVRFNRRNSQIRPDDEKGLGDVPAVIGRYRLQNICNMDQTPIPFEYLDGRTYNKTGERTVWLQSSQSGWDKRQGTIQLTIFADGEPHVKPLIFFRGMGVGSGILAEMKGYDPRVVVKFNPKAYANAENMVEWLDEQVIPVLDNQPTLLAVDLFGGHKTDTVLDTLTANDITISTIPGGCTGLVQPLDVSINRPFKDILKVIPQS
jgi:hypothetical protein